MTQAPLQPATPSSSASTAPGAAGQGQGQDHTVSGGSNGSSMVLREFADYEQAQRLVDSLSDSEFPVEHIRIVGLDVRTEEQVTGRMTKGKAALAGAAGGAWFGLLFGVLLGIFAPGVVWLSVILGSVVFAAFWGTIFGFVAHWATRGKRDFASVQSIKAGRYAVMVDSDYFSQALSLTSRV